MDWTMWKHQELCLFSSRPKGLRCHQEVPQKEYVKAAWGQACALLCGHNGKLKTPLGKWLIPADKLRQQWPAFYDPPTDRMFRTRKPNGFTVHKRYGNGYTLSTAENSTTLPLQAVPMYASMSDSMWLSPRTYKLRLSPPPQPSPPRHFYQLVRQMDAWEKCLGTL